MAVPKRKVSKTRKRKRRTNWKVSPPGLVKCPKCDEFMAPHKACPHCGYYKNRKVIEIE
jgi:large subunit ribosomal protein L32